MTTPGAPTRAECVSDLRQAYADEWQRLHEDARRRGAGPATETAINPEKARRRLEGIQAAARAGRAA